MIQMMQAVAVGVIDARPLIQTMQGVELLPMDPPDDWSGCRETMQGVELLPMDPADDWERMP